MNRSSTERAFGPAFTDGFHVGDVLKGQLLPTPRLAALYGDRLAQRGCRTFRRERIARVCRPRATACVFLTGRVVDLWSRAHRFIKIGKFEPWIGPCGAYIRASTSSFPTTFRNNLGSPNFGALYKLVPFRSVSGFQVRFER
jgi:hypothetical protein